MIHELLLAPENEMLTISKAHEVNRGNEEGMGFAHKRLVDRLRHRERQAHQEHRLRFSSGQGVVSIHRNRRLLIPLVSCMSRICNSVHVTMGLSTIAY